MKTTRSKNCRSALVIVALVASLLVLATASTRQDALAGPVVVSGASIHASAPNQSQVQPQSPVGSGFSYQGQLKDGGNPANGNYDFTFKLYDASSGGTQVGSTLTMLNQTVSGGLFSATLDFGAGAYQGQGRWLEMAVKVAGGGSYTTLSPRQPLSATPYASSLIPGATITATTGIATAFGAINNSGTAVYGESANSYGVRGQSTTNYGVYGFTSGAATGAGVLGTSNGMTGVGVQGMASIGPLAKGVWGISVDGYGVYGSSTNAWGIKGTGASGVWGEAIASNGTGVYGSSSGGYGVHGTSSSNWGIKGSGTSGVWGEATASNGIGVNGTSSASNGVSGTTGGGGTAAGVRGTSTGVQGTGVWGTANNGTSAYGVWGDSDNGWGVYGQSDSNWGVKGRGTSGVWGEASASNGTGVAGTSSGGSALSGVTSSGFGVYAEAATGVAGYFQGDIIVQGNCIGCLGPDKIDHPLDPENKFLAHTAVQSAEMKNVYDGNVTTDAKGEAVVALPDWFEALNRDFRYQLTVIGEFANAIVASKIRDNRFTIRTDKPNVEVSWQVTGIRKDPYAEAHPIPVEVEKSAEEKGKYLHPTEHGQPESKGIHYEEKQRTRQDVSKPQAPKP